MFRSKASAESCLRGAGSLGIVTLLFDKLTDCAFTGQIAAKRAPSGGLALPAPLSPQASRRTDVQHSQKSIR
jgi:hypothetical protein